MATQLRCQSSTATTTTIHVDDPDLPAESFLLPAEDEDDWVDRNAAAFYDRGSSTKGITNPKSQNDLFLCPAGIPGRPNKHPTAASSFAPNLTAPSGGGPVTAFHTWRPCCRRPNLGGGQFLPVPNSEPGSPDVSCTGKVRSSRRRAGDAGGLWAVVRRKIYCCGGSPPSCSKMVVAAAAPGLAGAMVVGRVDGEVERSLPLDGQVQRTVGPVDRV